MTLAIKQSTAFHCMVFLADSADGKTGKASATLAVTVSKNGGAFGSISPTVTDRGNGDYDIAATSSESDTIGCGALRATATGADPIDALQLFQVVAYDPTDSVRLGLTALPNAAAEAAGGLYTRGTGAGQIRQDANGRIDCNAKAWIDGAIPAVNVTGVPLVDVKYNLGTVAPAPTVAGIPKVEVSSIVANAITSTSIASDAITAAKIADNAIDRATFAQDAKDVLGEVLRFTAAAGSTTTVTFPGGASAVNDFYKNEGLLCVGGAGSGQTASVASYAGATKVATLDRTVATAFDGTSIFELLASGGGGGTVDLTPVTSKTDNLPSDPADASDIAAAFATISADAGAGLTAVLTAIDGIPAATAARTIEGSYTGDDLTRLGASILAGPVTDFTTGNLVFKSLNGAKTRTTIVTGPTGRVSVVIGDLT